MHLHRRAMQVIMPVCSRLAGRHIDTTFGIMDVAGGWQGKGLLTSYATWLFRFYIVRMISDCGIHRIRSGSNSPQKRRLGA